MKCPMCGNEISREEAFCGQCGTPSPLTPPAQPNGRVGNPHSGLLGGHHSGTSPFAGPPQSQRNPPSNFTGSAYSHPQRLHPPTGSNFPTPTNGPLPPPVRTQNLYQNPPENMQRSGNTHTNLSGTDGQMPQQTYGHNQRNSQNYSDVAPTFSPPTRPQPRQQNTRQLNSAVGNPQSHSGIAPDFPPPVQQYSPRLYNSSSHTPQNRMTPNHHHSGLREELSRSQHLGTQNNEYSSLQGNGQQQVVRASNRNTRIAIISLFIVLILIISIGVGIILATNTTRQLDSTQKGPGIATPTVAANDPTVKQTSTADANLVTCQQACSRFGFTTKYPVGWQTTQLTTAPGVLITSPQIPEVLTEYQTPDPSIGGTAQKLIENMLRSKYASKPDYASPKSFSTTTIAGTNWTYAIATYAEGSPTRIEMYATVYGGKNYTIELVAPEAQFEEARSQYFSIMLNTYQFA